MTISTSRTIEQQRLTVQGIVQKVGFQPCVLRLLDVKGQLLDLDEPVAEVAQLI